jgi:hypothetical protein
MVSIVYKRPYLTIAWVAGTLLLNYSAINAFFERATLPLFEEECLLQQFIQTEL